MVHGGNIDAFPAALRTLCIVSYVMQHMKVGDDFAGEVNFHFFIWYIRAFYQLKNDISFIKIDQGIQIS